MAEEHRCQAPRLCVNNCGFFGSPATQNLCSKCYRDIQLKEQQSSNAKLALTQSRTTATATSSSPSEMNSVSLSPSDLAGDQATHRVVESKKVQITGQQPNRCLTCRKRVGLTGFKCRCGMTYCGSHRYPEQHDCRFDFKSMGKEQIAKANPVVKGNKLDKI